MRNKSYRFNFFFKIVAVIIILYFTLISRNMGQRHIFKPLFWEIMNGYWEDIGLNILLFVPLGFAVGGRKVVLSGFILSMGIEMAQYIFCLGYCEIDDILNNTIGTIMGAILHRFILNTIHYKSNGNKSDFRRNKTLYKHFFKRFLDVILSIIGLPLFFLIFIVLAPIIHFTDRGPVFYNAPRLGKNGRVFNMYKFRSMRVNAPDLRNEDGSTYNSENDSRVTAIGRIMRKCSLDETPQILNVIKGDMSLIGPRPTIPSVDFRYQDLDDMQKKHYTVRPGITGYSQAYYRNSVSQIEKFNNDAYYADNVSLSLDLKIMIRTVFSVIMKKDIYTN